MTEIRSKFGAVKVASPPGHHLPTLQRAAQCAEPLRLRHASGGSVGWRWWRWRSEMCYETMKKWTYAGWVLFWNMAGLFAHVLGRIIPTDELIFFRGVETTDQYVFVWWLIWFDLTWQIDGWMDGWMHRCLHNILLCINIYIYANVYYIYIFMRIWSMCM